MKALMEVGIPKKGPLSYRLRSIEEEQPRFKKALSRSFGEREKVDECIARQREEWRLCRAVFSQRVREQLPQRGAHVYVREYLERSCRKDKSTAEGLLLTLLGGARVYVVLSFSNGKRAAVSLFLSHECEERLLEIASCGRFWKNWKKMHQMMNKYFSSRILIQESYQ